MLFSYIIDDMAIAALNVGLNYKELLSGSCSMVERCVFGFQYRIRKVAVLKERKEVFTEDAFA